MNSIYAAIKQDEREKQIAVERQKREADKLAKMDPTQRELYLLRQEVKSLREAQSSKSCDSSGSSGSYYVQGMSSEYLTKEEKAERKVYLERTSGGRFADFGR